MRNAHRLKSWWPLRGVLGTLTVVAIVVAAIPAMSDETNQRTLPSMDRLYSQIRTAVRRYYPDASSHLFENKIHFEHRTRIFIVHIPSKTGEWQDPVERRGPRKGGVLGDVELRHGGYHGAAAVPQVLDRHYYHLHLLAPYSAKFDCYAYVHFLVPRQDVPPGFVDEFTNIINDFERYLGPPE